MQQLLIRYGSIYRGGVLKKVALQILKLFLCISGKYGGIRF